MYCPKYIVVLNKYVGLVMHSDRDVAKKFVPRSHWLNPFRYSFSFFPKAYGESLLSFSINKNGRAWLSVSNAVYSFKAYLKKVI